jgi:hypothetical protein
MGDDFDAMRPSLANWDYRLLMAEQVQELDEEGQLEYMEAWFRHFFEDPANETPHDSGEGGYQYIWGGPYDHREELQSEFEGVVSDELIERLAQTLDGYGHEWAPTSNHPARADDRPDDENEESWDPDLGTLIDALERGQEVNFDAPESPARATIAERLQAVEQALAELQHGGIGHNQPPEAIEVVEALEDAQQQQIASAIGVVRVEITKARPDALEVGYAALSFRNVGTWLARKADKAADEAAKVVGKGVGYAALAGGAIAIGAAAGQWHHLAQLLAGVARAIAIWIAQITGLF